MTHAANLFAGLNIHHLADARQGVCHIFIRDLIVNARIGIHGYEQDWWQPVCININMAVREETAPEQEKRFKDVVCYKALAERIRTLTTREHVALVENLAESIASVCLEDTRVLMVRVRVEKPKAVEHAAGAGVEIERVSPRLESHGTNPGNVTEIK